MKAILSLVTMVLITQTASALQSFKLNNDVIVGSKIYVRYDDVVRIGNPVGGWDDEGYCVVDDSAYSGFDNFKNSRVLPKGTVLEGLGYEYDRRKDSTGKNVQDTYALVKSPRGELRIGCSIDTSASERNSYSVNMEELAYLKSIGIESL